MVKNFFIIFLILIFSSNAYANKNKKTWDYPLLEYSGWVIEGSENHYTFQSNLRENKDVLKEFKNNKNTGIISYLLFENDKIVIDVSDIPKKVSSGHTILDGLLPSHSMGKSLVSYVTGHAICEGYIDNINVRLNDWPLIQNTLYQDSILLDLLNMKGGDQKYIGERLKPQKDNKLKKDNENVNVIGLERVMNKYLRGTEKSKLVYNYSALTTNVIMNYVKHKAGADWEKLLHKVFNEHVKVKNSVQFQRSKKYFNEDYVSARYSFYATRYDYLRIAKTMMEDWHNDTCAGKYLKTIYENRVQKKDNTKKATDVGLYTKSYGGQIHFDIFGIDKTRKILGLSGFAGQQILIDLDNKRIIVVSSLYRNYNWKKIVHSVIKG
ncbi:hypothetical protein OAL94_00890 [Candidatus Pelagibacter sp.]|nr:hypothetical protein [Candidatus Pelagibacter sp.]